VLGLFSTPFAKFVEFNFLGDELLIFAGPVIYPFAGTTAKFYKSIL